ncbi:MAG: hypothetical protein HY343_03145 [Lentisphaerae bacterium]|nr:hypothetical protein [Lentisphaerota bacterium]
MKHIGVCVAFLLSAVCVWAQTPAKEVVTTNIFMVTGSQMQEGKWQKQITTLPEGATLTITAEPLEGLQKAKQGQEPRLGIRLGPAYDESWCDARGRWTSKATLLYGPQSGITLTVPKDAALFVSPSVTARFRVKVEVHRPAPPPTSTNAPSKETSAQPAPPPAPAPAAVLPVPTIALPKELPIPQVE